MRTLLNLIWLVLAGIWLALLYVIAGVLISLTIIGIPFGVAAFRMAGMALWPFGRQVVKKADAGVGSTPTGPAPGELSEAPRCWWRYVLALLLVVMATETATIRVSRETRDLLAEQARERGVSVASMLQELARAAERESIFQSEREASRTDAGSHAAQAEEREWERALGDGID